MRKFYKYLLPSLLILALAGCSGDSKSSVQESSSSQAESSETTSSAESEMETTTQADEKSAENEMPVIKIETVNQDSDVMDFVKKPVAHHVSEQIATWTPNYKIPPEPYYELCRISVSDGDNVLIDSVDADVKVRGNWTTTYDKKSLRIKFAQKQNLLGMNNGSELKNWLLLAEYKDGSMLRNKTALAIADEILAEDGLYASDAEFVEVYINDEYWGVYLLAEQQQINSDRVNIAEAQPDYMGTDIGYLLEFDGYFYTEAPLQQFHVDYADNAPLKAFDGDAEGGMEITCLPKTAGGIKNDIGFSIKNDIYSQEQHDFIASFVNNTYQIMYEAAYNDKAFAFNEDYTAIAETSDMTPQEAVESVVNVESLADMYIIEELACDADVYWSSFYMDADFSENGNKKLTFEAPWDFDSSMGNKNRCINGKDFFAASIVPDSDGINYQTINPWLAVLMHEDWYQDIIREKWSKAYDSGVFERAYEMIEHDKTAYQQAFERNYGKWNNIINNNAFAEELSLKASECKNHAEATDFMLEWLHSRVDFLNEYWHK